MKSVVVIQNATSDKMTTGDFSAEKARTGASIKSSKIKVALNGLSTIDNLNRKAEN
jgi:hypothetical protein